ncbi:MAG: hypothetical protein JWQ27_163 [Ferruginibacter sp.]|nr:hypothetical protein [Ferruginibacter sp.]
MIKTNEEETGYTLIEPTIKLSKKILIIYPHFPPSNLAGVHRARLFAQHLPAFGWEPTVLTVDEKYYEEALDWNLHKLLPATLRIEKVAAYAVTKPRLAGDIGLRAFFQLYKKAKSLIRSEGFDFLYIPIPSFYMALLGRKLHAATGIRYGIDYIDPWVHQFPGSERTFSRHWFSTKLAAFLEPIAIKKASLITGVAEGYYKDVLTRNPQLQQVITGAMPYGGEKADHEQLVNLDLKPYLFPAISGKFRLVYAGAFLPKAIGPLEAMFKAISAHKIGFRQIEFHFIGTGKTPDDPTGFNIRELAMRYGLWEDIVYEYPKRIPYLDVLMHLSVADAVFILGSTEPHYTPSKVYQGVLSAKPIFAILHQESTAVEILTTSRAGEVLSFNGTSDLAAIERNFVESFFEFKLMAQRFNPGQVDQQLFDKYSAYNVTGQLAGLLDKAVAK